MTRYFLRLFITINLGINIENLLFIEVRMYTILRFILSDVSIFPIVGYKKRMEGFIHRVLSKGFLSYILFLLTVKGCKLTKGTKKFAVNY